MKEITNNKKEINIEMLFIYCLVFLLTFRVTGHLIDVPQHTIWADQIDFSNFAQTIKVISYPIWHIGVAILIKYLSIPAIYAAPLINALFVVLSMIAIRYTLDISLKLNISERIKNYTTLVLTFVSAINIPWYNSQIYYGQGSINPWHNPTYITVKPFAIICFLLFIRLYKMDSIKKMKILSRDYNVQNLMFILFSLLVLTSTFAKPSFLQVFLPAVMLFLIIKLIISNGKIFSFCLKTALCFLPVSLVLICQYIISFGTQATTDNKVIFSFFDVWKYFSSNVILSILLLLAFPIYILIINFKYIFKDEGLLLSIIIALVGIAQYGLLAESGNRKFHGNFSWGYMIAALILWITTTVRFLQMYAQDKEKKGYKLKITIGYLLLFVHFITGLYYFYLLWNGATY